MKRNSPRLPISDTPARQSHETASERYAPIRNPNPEIHACPARNGETAVSQPNDINHGAHEVHGEELRSRRGSGMVSREGLEPSTYGLKVRCSTS